MSDVPPTHPQRTLDARYYTDPRIFEIEREGLLAKTWQFGCHASQVSEPGAYATFEIAGESLFAIRGRDNEIRVFYNVCQHRAHQLVQGSGKAGVIVCP
ncbi:MAG: Rieske 2Fe-2S domain-containing protein, partial [Pseudomonadota bacterium]